MSSVLIFDDGFGDSRQAPRWWRDVDGAYATARRSDEAHRVVWDLTDYLANTEQINSSSYTTDGVTVTSYTTTTPQVSFTAAGIGEVTVTAFTSGAARKRVQVFRIYSPDASPRSDYGR